MGMKQNEIRLLIEVQPGPTLLVDGAVACYPLPETERQREARWRCTVGQIALEKSGMLGA